MTQHLSTPALSEAERTIGRVCHYDGGGVGEGSGRMWGKGGGGWDDGGLVEGYPFFFQRRIQVSGATWEWD